jgi:hypothetical protein
MIVGGMGTFLNSITYTACAVLIPLLLMKPGFGIVPDSSSRRLDESGSSSDASNLTAAESQKLSLTLGYLLG